MIILNGIKKTLTVDNIMSQAKKWSFQKFQSLFGILTLTLLITSYNPPYISDLFHFVHVSDTYHLGVEHPSRFCIPSQGQSGCFQEKSE